jgi:hypothetical protein
VVPTVQSLGDLDAQPAIEFRPGCVARFGVSDAEVPVGSGVLVYCLLDCGAAGRLDFKLGSGVTLGPYSLRWLDDKAFRPKVKRYPTRGSCRRRRELFVAVMPVACEKSRELGIYLDGVGLVAKSRITGRSPRAQAWYPLLSAKWDVPEGTPEVLPARDGDLPVAPKELEGGKLPSLVPDCEGGLEVRAEAQSIHLSSAEGMSSRPDRQIVARFWVNGQPVLWCDRKELLDDQGMEQTVTE